MNSTSDVLNERLSLVAIGYNSTVGRWRSEAMRSHRSPRLIYFSKGQGRITVAGSRRGYGPNNLVYIPANTMYGYEIGTTVFGQMLTIPTAMAADWPEEPVHLRVLDVLAQKELALHFDNLERELLSDRSGHSRAAHLHLGLLAVLFERQLIEQEPQNTPDTAPSESAAGRLAAAFSDLVERDYRSKKSVAAYAAILGVTPTHLSRSCKQACGKSALAIINDRILFEARLLLSSSRTPVQEIAKSLGFASAAYFSRSFHAATGQTPSDFRKAAQIGTAKPTAMFRT